MSEDDRADLLRDVQEKRDAIAACPQGHINRGQLAMELGRALHRSFRQIGDVALINEAIDMEREALDLCPPSHPDRARRCSDLGDSLKERSIHMLDVAQRDESNELYREALALRPPGHRERVLSCERLGVSLGVRFRQCGDLALLDESIELLREARTLRPLGHPKRAGICHQLTVLIHARYWQGRDPSLLDEEIDLQRETLGSRPPGHPHRAISCQSLGASLHSRYKRGGSFDMLNEAIKLEREALALRPPGHPDRAFSCLSLGASLSNSYEQCGDLDILDESIKLKREALTMQPPGHPDRVLSCSNLAGSLHHRYNKGGDLNILDEAIALEREALALRPPGHPNRPISCQNLGVLLLSRYEQSGDVDMLDEAIKLQREGLTMRPPGHPDRVSSCQNLGASLHNRYERCGDLNILEEVIKLQHEALTLRHPGHPSRARSCANLGTSLQSHYNQFRNPNVLDEGIRFHREALALRPPGHPDRVWSCQNLGASLQYRYSQSGDLGMLDEAIKLGREALTMQSFGHPNRAHFCTNLAYSLLRSYRQTHIGALLDEMIELSDYALKYGSSWEVSRACLFLVELHLIPSDSRFSITEVLRYLVLTFESEIPIVREYFYTVSSVLSDLWGLSSMWADNTPLLLCDVYIMFVDRLPLAAGFALNNTTRLEILASTRHIGTDACVAAVLAKQPSKAIELLSRAHGLVWTQALHQRDPQMEGAPPELAAELAGLLRAMSVPMPTHLGESSRPAHYQDDRHNQNTRIQALLREIRGIPGLERFMLGSTYETLRQAAHEHPVVMLVAGHGHAFALVMSTADADQPQVLHLELTSGDLSGLRNTVEKAGLRSTATLTTPNTEPETGLDLRDMRPGTTRTSVAPSDVLSTLWRKIVEPIISHLQLQKNTGQSRPRLHWCPNGDFVFLPLHAAGIYKGPPADRVCCSDYVVSSYTPTISALLRAQAKATSVASSEVNMLLVGEDCTTDLSQNSLWGVQKELEAVEAIATQFGHAVETITRAATVERVTERVKSANFVHLACHGIQDRKSALESGFHLSDSRLTISKLMELELKCPWFAYLSACETAKGDAEQPDQLMHLAAAMLFTGFKHVVATMWVMNDEDGPELAKWFYEGLMSNDTVDADAVAYALDDAVQKLRAKEPSPNRWAQFIHVGA